MLKCFIRSGEISYGETKNMEKAMKKRKLLIATDSFLPRWDGIARFLSESIPDLKDKFDITVVCPDYGKAPFIENVRIVRFPHMKMKIGDYYPAKVNYKTLKKEVADCDILFVQTQGPIGFLSILFARFKGKPIVSFVHSLEWELFSKSAKSLRGLVKFVTKIYSRWLYNKSTILMVPYLELKEIMRRHGVKRPDMVVTRLGTNIEKFVKPDDKEKAKEGVEIDPSRIVIGFTGRIGREKDIPTLIKAFKELEKEYDYLTLLIVGKGIDTIEKELGLSKNVKAVGKKDEILPYLQAMDIFVLPSLTETTSLATLEAMSCSVPVVVTPVGYVKGYVKDKFNGLVFPVRNSLVLKLKLKQLLDDHLLRDSLGKHGRATVVKKFDWKKTIERLKFILGQF